MKLLQSGYRASIKVGALTMPAPTTWEDAATTAEVTQDRSPGAKFPDAVGGLPTLAPITVGWTDRSEFTDAMLATLRNSVGGDDNSVTATLRPVSKSGNSFRKGETFVGTPTEYRGPSADANSSDRGEIRLTFQPSSVS